MPWVHEGHPKMFVDSTLFSSQLDSVSVKHTALSLVAVILKRALKTIEHCLQACDAAMYLVKEEHHALRRR